MSYRKLVLKSLAWSSIAILLILLSPTKLLLAVSLVLFNICFEFSLLHINRKSDAKEKAVRDEELYDIYGGD